MSSASSVVVDEKYYSEEERFKSFAGWDRNILMDPEILAKYGFYQYQPNVAVCNFCGIATNGINDGEFVYEMHLRLNNNCPLMTGRVTKNIPLDTYRFAYSIGSLNFNLKRRAMVDKARFPQFGDLIVRKDTFDLERMSLKDKANAIRMATYGYFKQNNIVQCFHCGVHDVRYLDQYSIMERHIITSPQCEFMVFAAGQNVIASILRRVFYNKRSMSRRFLRTIKAPINPSQVENINKYFKLENNCQDVVGEIEHNENEMEI